MSSEGMENALMASTEGGAGVTAGAPGLPPAPAAPASLQARCKMQISVPAAAVLSSSSIGATATCAHGSTSAEVGRGRACATHELRDVGRKRAGHEKGEGVGDAGDI